MIQSKLKLRKSSRTVQTYRAAANYNIQLGRIWFQHIRTRLAAEDYSCESWPKTPEQQTFQWR